MRLSAAVLLLLSLLAVPVNAQDAPAPAAWPGDQFGIQVPMRDGKSLSADVYLPAKPGRWPAIVVQTPYDRTKVRAGLAAPHGGFDAGRRGGETVSGIADREHYAYVVTDWRGFFGSRAAGAPGRAGTLGKDGYDVVEWTAAQTWCDGKVGTWGPSALGVVQFQTAAERPPHLVCAVPLVSALGWRWDDYFERGVLREHHIACLDRLGFGVGARVRDARNPGGMLWRAARLAERPASIDVPMLLVTGWFDHATARTLDTFRTLVAEGGPAARAGSRLLVGPWHHTAVDLAEQGDLQSPLAAGEAGITAMAWFDKWLRGVGAGGFAEGERVRFWQMGRESAASSLTQAADLGGTWLRAAQWPRPGGTTRTWTLHASGAIDASPPGAGEPVRAIYDDPENPVPTIGGANLPLFGMVAGPRDQKALLDRRDVLVYTTDALADAVRIEGAPSVTLSVASDAPDTDVAVRLCQVMDDGRTILLADSIARASFLEGASGGRALLEPGEPREVTVHLPPLSLVLPKYGRLRLLVSGTNSPRFERNGHTGAAAFDAKWAVATRVEFLHDAAHPARLVLPLAP